MSKKIYDFLKGFIYYDNNKWEITPKYIKWLSRCINEDLDQNTINIINSFIDSLNNLKVKPNEFKSKYDSLFRTELNINKNFKIE